LSIDAEIIVVDNHSSDDSCGRWFCNFSTVKTYSNDNNLGFPKGSNIGVAHAKGICFAFKSSAVCSQKILFSKMVYFAQTPRPVGIDCKLIDG
jgi:glycosyltransferase involved in cell wall biosynthesis